MGINFKPVNELEEITKLAEGDKILVNSGGAARQIDVARVVLGGGGGSTLYADGNEDITTRMSVYADAELTQQLTYAQGVELMSGPFAIVMMVDGAVMGVIMPPMWMPSGNTNVIQLALSVAGQNVQPLLIFSDSTV